MKFLLDMGISPGAAAFLRRIGHDAIHLSEQGLGRLPDADVLTKARTERRIVLTHDLDFADLLAASGADLPSVVLFRLSDMRPSSIERRLVRLLENYASDLEQGAIVSVSDRQIRVRTLPITSLSRRSRQP